MSKTFGQDFYTDDFDKGMIDYLIASGWVVQGNTSDSKPNLSQPYLKYGAGNEYFWTSEQDGSYYIKLTKQEFKEKIGMNQNQGHKLADGSYSGEYKIGDKFEVVNEGTFDVGSVVEFIYNDDSSNPKFKSPSEGAWYCLWEFLKPYKEPAKQFTKSDLRGGMICTSRGGYTYTVQGDRMVRDGGMYMLLENIEDDLTVNGGDNDLDIMKVEQPTVLFIREEPPVKSPAQIELDKLQEQMVTLHEQIAALQEQANKLQGTL